MFEQKVEEERVGEKSQKKKTLSYAKVPLELFEKSNTKRRPPLISYI